MTEFKIIEPHREAIAKLREDIGRSNYVWFDIANFPSTATAAFYTDSYLTKLVSMSVITSTGSTAAGVRDWMLFVPFRIDVEQGRKVYDQDPSIFTFDADSGSPAETGVVAYHQKYPGRTTPILGYEHLSVPETVAALRQQFVPCTYPAAEAPESVIQALGHMAVFFIGKSSTKGI